MITMMIIIIMKNEEGKEKEEKEEEVPLHLKSRAANHLYCLPSWDQRVRDVPEA